MLLSDTSCIRYKEHLASERARLMFKCTIRTTRAVNAGNSRPLNVNDGLKGRKQNFEAYTARDAIHNW